MNFSKTPLYSILNKFGARKIPALIFICLSYSSWAQLGPGGVSTETPNTQSSLFKYSDGKMLEFETRGRYSNGESSLGIKVGNMFYGTEGYLEIDGGTWKAFRERENEPFAGSKVDVNEKENASDSLIGSSSSTHWANLLDAIKSGNNDLLNCDINEGFHSSALPMLENISYRLGSRELKFMGDYEKFANDTEANTLLTTVYRPPYVVPHEV